MSTLEIYVHVPVCMCVEIGGAVGLGLGWIKKCISASKCTGLDILVHVCVSSRLRLSQYSVYIYFESLWSDETPFSLMFKSIGLASRSRLPTSLHLTSIGGVIAIIGMRIYKILMNILDEWEMINRLQYMASSRWHGRSVQHYSTLTRHSPRTGFLLGYLQQWGLSLSFSR